MVTGQWWTGDRPKELMGMEPERDLRSQLPAHSPDSGPRALDRVPSLQDARAQRRAASATLRAAPLDDEPDTPAERAEAAEARTDYQHNGGVSAEEARQRLG
jgi:hypothetical protein